MISAFLRYRPGFLYESCLCRLVKLTFRNGASSYKGIEHDHYSQTGSHRYSGTAKRTSESHPTTRGNLIATHPEHHSRHSNSAVLPLIGRRLTE